MRVERRVKATPLLHVIGRLTAGALLTCRVVVSHLSAPPVGPLLNGFWEWMPTLDDIEPSPFETPDDT